MAFQTVAVTDVRRGLRVILAGLTRPLFVTQRGRVKAVLLDIEAYNNLLDELDDARLAADPEIRRVMADVKDAYKRGEMVPLEDALGHAP
ncbi:MAG: hypothetical protein AB1566_04400 [Chloroflexota bacterium]|jgi:PHD/YefM family antitoxin component YafN of YafNO toxin-antitoxin module